MSSPANAGGDVAVSGDRAVPSPAESPAPTRAEVQAAAQAVNETLSSLHQQVEFRMDPDTKSIVIRLVDKQENRVLRQVPSEEMLAIARSLDRMRGLLLSRLA
jgi:flagellar protein FlaG